MKTLDFETDGIVGNPLVNPPKPCGLAIKNDDGTSEYLAWGHPTNNNCSLEKAIQISNEIIESGEELLFHYAPFDISVGVRWMKWNKRKLLKDPLKIHDTQYLIFLSNPYARSFALKPSAERILNWPPEERDLLKEWILANVPEARAKPSEWGAYISRAPGDLVGKYACGDTDRTRGLFNYLHPLVLKDQMLAAYRREQKLMPIMLRSTVKGIRVDRKRLAQDYEEHYKVLGQVDKHVFGVLGTEFNIDSDEELANALERADLVTSWVMTPKGKRSTARKNLRQCLKTPEIIDVLSYRGMLATILGTFAGPWLNMSAADGRLHTEWNQVRGDKTSRDVAGTRTGRLSSMTPNFQNVISEFVKAVNEWPELMRMRSYLLPEEGHVWLKRDFSAQEMRIMAHFAEGRLFEAFRANPKTDPHVAVQKIIHEITGILLERKPVKITGFGIMYGRGIDNLALALDVERREAENLRNAYYEALPEVRTLSNRTRNRGRSGQAIRTWGGRLYYREPNPDRDLSYKLLNYLIQGSAADQTKESIIHWDGERLDSDVFLATVHDENNISALEANKEESMRILRTSMDLDRFDVPFCSDGFVGPNWQDIEGCDW